MCQHPEAVCEQSETQNMRSEPILNIVSGQKGCHIAYAAFVGLVFDGHWKESVKRGPEEGPVLLRLIEIRINWPLGVVED